MCMCVCVWLSYLGGGGWWGWLGCCIFAGRRRLTHRRRSDNRIHLLPPFTYASTAFCCSLRFALCSRQRAFGGDVGMKLQPQQSVVPSMSTVKMQGKREHQANVHLFPVLSRRKAKESIKQMCICCHYRAQRNRLTGTMMKVRLALTICGPMAAIGGHTCLGGACPAGRCGGSRECVLGDTAI